VNIYGRDIMNMLMDMGCVTLIGFVLNVIRGCCTLSCWEDNL
jgi:hypothetical protein